MLTAHRLLHSVSSIREDLDRHLLQGRHGLLGVYYPQIVRVPPQYLPGARITAKECSCARDSTTCLC
jgi:hypothetical protein